MRRWPAIALFAVACGARVSPVPATVIAAPSGLDVPGLIALRREIHRHPELANHESRTAALVAERLRALGLEVRERVGGHGVIAWVRGARPGPLIAYRSELDAVAAETRTAERAELPFRSQVEGAAHLSGHDIHVAVAVGVAEILAAERATLPGTVELLFEPAEEEQTGAKAMTAAGALEPLPREIYAVRSFPLAVGTIGFGPGVGLAGLDRFDVMLPAPEPAAELAAQIEQLGNVHRPSDGAGWQRLMAALTADPTPLASFVSIHAAVENAIIHVEVRAAHDRDYPRTRMRIGMLAAMAGGEPRPAGELLPAMINDAALSEAAVAPLAAVVGREHLVRFSASFPFDGDDFAFYRASVPGALFWLGVGAPADAVDGLPRAPDFQADEGAIAVGARAMAALLRARLAAGAP